MDTTDRSSRSTSDGQLTPTQDSRSRGPGSSTHQSIRSPEPPHSGSRPKTGRRASSKQAPHRGQEFSVDDETEEVESDMARRKASHSAKASGTALRRQPSNLRPRPTNQPSMPKIDSRDEEDDEGGGPQGPDLTPEDSGEVFDESSETAQADGEDEDDGNVSDAESFTLKDKQNAINETHPFGIRIWKPALYKKNRSVEKTAEGDIHSSPGARVSKWLAIFNVFWTILFGWWLALATAFAALVCYIFAFTPEATAYGRVFLGLSRYFI